MNKILKVIPETKILNESRIPYNNTITDGQSIWVPEEKYWVNNFDGGLQKQA